MADKVAIELEVNGAPRTVYAYPMARLLDVLREELLLTGVKEGCGEGECGACSVLINGQLVNSCLVPVLHTSGSQITTIEGLASGDQLHPVQEAFISRGGAQCGICTPGMILAAAYLLKNNPHPTEAEIREGLAGNLCRCTGYMRIFDAVQKGSRRMRAYLPDYELVAPVTLAAALSLLANEPDKWKPFAGGTDLMVLLEAGKLEHKQFISLWGLEELHGISESPQAITLGALTTYNDVLRSRVLSNDFPMLAQAARETGGVATQNRGTLGGNIVNASPAADSPPALLAYDAELELMSATGSRWVPYHGFHTGYKKTVMQPGEIVSRIRLPRRSSGWQELYRKVGTRKAQAISKVCIAARVHLDDDRVVHDSRIALGSVAPIPLRCSQTEALLNGKPLTPELIAAARAQIETEVAPINDIRSTQDYRRRVAGNLLEDFLRSL